MIRFFKILFLCFLLALLNGAAMADSFEDVSFNIGIVSNNLEEDLDEEGFIIINGEYDAVGAGGSDKDNITQKNQIQKKHNFSCTAVQFIADSPQITFFYYSQYLLSLQRSLVISPFFILYCCAKDDLLFCA